MLYPVSHPVEFKAEYITSVGSSTGIIKTSVAAFHRVCNQVNQASQEHESKDEGNQPRDGWEQCSEHCSNCCELHGQDQRLRHEPGRPAGTSNSFKHTVLSCTQASDDGPQTMAQAIGKSLGCYVVGHDYLPPTASTTSNSITGVIFNKPNANFTIFPRSPTRSMAWTMDLKPDGTKTYAKTIRPTPLLNRFRWI